MADVLPLTYRVEEAAALLGVNRGTVYEGVRTKAIPAIRIGRRILISRVALDRFLAGQLPAVTDATTS